MENLRRLGGEVGVLAGIATAWVFLGFIFIFPTAGLDYVDQVNPHRYLPFMTQNQILAWSVHVLGGLVAALATAVLFVALQDRFSSSAPGSAKLGAGAGLFGAGTLAAAVLVRQAGFDVLAGVYMNNANSGAYAFYALQGLVTSLESLSAFATGLGILVLGKAMVAEAKARYASVGYLSVVVGVVMVFAAFASHVLLFMVSTLGMIAWLMWTALTLRTEAGPAFFTAWWPMVRKRRANGARKAA